MLAAQRLRAQRVVADTCASPADVVSSLLAVQAQDPAAAKWAVGFRMADDAAVDTVVERALAEGAILRTHVMRWTWQLVCPVDVRWLLSLTAQRLFQKYARRHRDLGLDAAVFKRSRRVVEKVLVGGKHLTRDELAAALGQAKLPSSGPCLSHVLAHAELKGVICSGTPRGKTATYALLDLRAPAAGPMPPRDEALAELARRYFQSRGPATVADFAWWAGLTTAEAKAGLADARSQLVSEIVDGTTFWRGGATNSALPSQVSPRAHLLPAFDEYVLAYRDRRVVLGGEHAKRINAGGGMLRPCVVVDGRIVGTWRRTLGSRTVDIELDLFEPQPAAARRAVAAAAARYGAFLELEVRAVDVRGQRRGSDG
jgi:hypothetical protein